MFFEFDHYLLSSIKSHRAPENAEFFFNDLYFEL